MSDELDPGHLNRFSEGVVLAAGNGLRLRPITKTCPKPLLPLSNGDVILDSIAENAKSMGLKRLWVIAGDHEDLFGPACLRISQQHGVQVVLRMLPEPTRTSVETLRFALQFVAAPLVVFLGDDVTISPSSMNLIEAFNRTKPALLEAVTEEKDPLALQRSCEVAIDGLGAIERIDEKPAASGAGIRGCGIYLLGDEAVEELRDGARDGIGGITQLVGHFAGRRKAAYEFVNGLNINVNTPEDLSRAQRFYEETHRTPHAATGRGGLC